VIHRVITGRTDAAQEPGPSSVREPASATSPSSAASARRGIEKAAAAFEEILVQTLVKSMREALPQDEGGIFGAGAGAGVYEGMFDEGLAEAVSSRLGLGLSKALIRQLSGPAAESSGSSATSLRGAVSESSQSGQVTVGPQVPRGRSDLPGRGTGENPWKERP
jgi:Rod binding domain-containing protein